MLALSPTKIVRRQTNALPRNKMINSVSKVTATETQPAKTNQSIYGKLKKTKGRK